LHPRLRTLPEALESIVAISDEVILIQRSQCYVSPWAAQRHAETREN
jgi:hypothetical protein